MTREDTALLLKIEEVIQQDPILDFCKWYSSQVGNYQDLLSFLNKKECDHIPDPIKLKMLNTMRDIELGIKHDYRRNHREDDPRTKEGSKS